MNTPSQPVISVIMGSQSDWTTMKNTTHMLSELEIPFETKIISAHRTPERLYTFAQNAENRGIKVIIAGAGGAAHLPGMTASMTILPVLGVPIESHVLQGTDSLLSIVQMPMGTAVGTLAIGKSGAINAALLGASIIALEDNTLMRRLKSWRQAQTENISEYPTDT